MSEAIMKEWVKREVMHMKDWRMEHKKPVWKEMYEKRELFDDSGDMRKEGEVAYLIGIIENNPTAVSIINDILNGGNPEGTSKGLQGMSRRRWLDALLLSDAVWITEGWSDRSPVVFEGKFIDYLLER